ncbi:MAG TPA: energy transducer TonB [Terriglobales bacterium]|nr:energy transducer TonB [Terriglobales bacterium]
MFKQQSSNIRTICAVVMLFGILSLGASAQSSRVVKSKVTPSYPELAKKMNVNGAVKVELQVAADGKVKTAKAIGGHPLLIDAALNAAKQFKYEAGDESKEIVEFKFNTGTGQ